MTASCTTAATEPPANASGVAAECVAPGSVRRDAHKHAGAIESFRIGRVDWRVRQDWFGRVVGPQAPNWFKLSREDRATRLKSGHRRGIWTVDLGEAQVHAKVSRFPTHSLRERLRLILRQTSVEREWRNVQRAAAQGAPVANVVALGVRRGRKPGAVLISESIPGGVTLAAAWAKSRRMAEPARNDEQLRLIGVAATTYAQAHAAGLVHGDNHPQNIVLSAGGTGAVGVLVDLASAKVQRMPASPRQRVANLAQLEHHFQRIATRTQRLRFLRAYLQCETGARALRRGWAERILAVRATHAVALARVRDRRILANNAYFAKLQPAPGWKVHVVLKLERRHVFPERGVPDRTREEWKAILAGLRQSIERAGAAQRAEADGVAAVAVESAGMQMVLGRGPRSARVMFVRTHQLRHRDIPSPLVLGCVSSRSGARGEWLLIPCASSAGRSSTRREHGGY